ncbi:MAG: translocation/assembly module TamB, partial [Myxococcota bacterium]|nr:translocation/assembly module TamB [Myxococcota bacterium]
GHPARGDVSGTMEWVEAPLPVACARALRPIVQLHGGVSEGVTRIDISAFAEGRHVAFARAEAETPIDDWLRDGTVAMPHPDLLVQLLDMPLEDVPWTCGRASGVATAEVVLRDLLSAAPEIDARMEIRDLRITNAEDAALRGTLPYHVLATAQAGGEAGERAQACAIFAAEGMLRTPFAECASASLPQETEAIVRGSLPLRWIPDTPLPVPQVEEGIDLALLMSNAHLEPLLALIPQIGDADVIADGRLVANGPWSNLGLSGGVQLAQGRVRIIPLGQQLVDIGGAIRFDGPRALIPQGSPLFARDGDGTVSIHGEIGLDGLLPTHAYLIVRPDQFPVRREGAVLATISGVGDTRLTIEADGLEGAIETERLTVRLPEQMAGNVQPIDSHPDILVVGTVAPDLATDERPAYPVHLRIDATQPFWIRRNDFAIQVTASLDVRYLDPNLYIGGYATLPRGYFEVFGKRFEVARGSLTFTGGDELDPIVDLVAVYELPGAPGANVTVAASGQISDLRIEFSSTETSDQGEIIALLVSGRRSLGVGDPGATQEASEQAARVVTGVAAGILTLGLRQQFGDIVPLIAIETGANLGDTRIRAGFNADAAIPEFLDDVVLGAYVEGFVTTSAGQSGAQGGVGGGVTIELQFPYDIVGSGTYVPPTSWGLDLLWEP